MSEWQSGGVPFEPYTDVACPRCGWWRTEDAGPYPDQPGAESDPSLHLMHCHWCCKSFDARPRPA